MSIWDTLFGGGDQTTTQMQTPQIPGFVQRPLESAFGRAEEESQRPYTTYGQPRIAPTSQFENASYNRLAQMFGVSPPSGVGPGAGFGDDMRSVTPTFPGKPPSSFGQAPGQPFDGAQGRPQYEPPVDYATTLAATAGERGLAPGQFTDPGVREQYMSPYMEDVIKRSQEEAVRASHPERQALDTQAAQMGAFGGGRHAVLEAERMRNLNTLVSDIGIRGRQSSFENAQQQYERDRGARLAGLNPALTASGRIGDLATTGQTLGLQGVSAVNTAGQQQRGTQQSSLDLAYQDFLNQRNYPRGNIQFLSDIIRGHAPQSGQSTTTTQSGGQPSFLAQLAGAGLGAYTIGRSFKKGGVVKSAFASGGAVGMQAGGVPPVVIGGRTFTIDELRSLPDDKLQGLIRISPGNRQLKEISGERIGKKWTEGFRSIFEKLKGPSEEEKVKELFPPTPAQVSDVPAGLPMPPSTFGTPEGKVDYAALRKPPWGAFESGRSTSAGLPSPTTEKPALSTVEGKDFFDQLNQPAFAAAMRMMGAQRGENLFQTLGAAGTAALTQRGAMKKETREEAEEKRAEKKMGLEESKVGIESRKAEADITEARSRASYYDKQAKSHGTPFAAINEKGQTILKYPDGFQDIVEGLPASVVTAESRIKPALDALKYAESQLKTDTSVIGGMKMSLEEVEKKRVQYQLEYYNAQQIPVPKKLIEKAKGMGINLSETD